MPSAVIFLHSCSTAKGKAEEDNLANFVMRSGRKVIAATDPFSSDQIEVKQAYPLKVEIKTDDKTFCKGTLTYKN